MKASQYNLFFDHEGQKIGFNSYTKEYIALDPLLHLMYDSAVRKGDFSEIREVHRELFDFLTEKGFIIEARIDELQRVKDMVEAIDNDDRVFELHINPTMNCNFKCWYCYETHIKESKMDEATFQNVILFIAKLLEEKKGVLERFSLGWFGGERRCRFPRQGKLRGRGNGQQVFLHLGPGGHRKDQEDDRPGV